MNDYLNKGLRKISDLLFKSYVKIIILIFCIIISTFLLPIVQADIISWNSGGSDELLINTDRYIEGFFFCTPYTCTELGYTCGTWDDGCGLALNCGTCGSGYTCTGGTCVAETPPSDGGGGGGGVTPTYNIALSPTEFNINMKISTNVKRVVAITNLGDSTITIGVGQSNLTNMVLFGNTSLTISSKQTVQLDVIFVAPEETGIYTGKIFVGGKTILVTLNVKTELLLFDSNIVVLNKNYEVRQGEQLKTLVTLIPIGDPTRLDVTLNFVIKDYANKIYLTRSETLLVEEQVQLGRNFDTGILPLGDYVIGLELVYPDGVAPSSAHFKVVKRPISTVIGRIILFLIILILLIAITIIVILIIKKIKERKQIQRPPSQGQAAF